MTKYVVLRSLGDIVGEENAVPDVWAIVGEVEAADNESACRKVAALLKSDGSYKAVPERSFQTVSIVMQAEPRFVVKGQTEIPVA